MTNADLRSEAHHLISAQADQLDQADNPVERLIASGCPIPEGYQIPADYDIDEKAVYTVKLVKRGDDVERVSTAITSAPCVVVGVLRDERGDELVELAWLHYGAWRRRAVPRDIVRSGRRLVAALGAAGFPVMDSTAKHLERWLDLVEAVNRAVLPIESIARVLGWQADGEFVSSPGTPRPVHPHSDGMEYIVAAHRARGTLAGWQQHVAKPLDGHPRAQMALYASLAAPLLQPLGLDSLIVDWSGQTTSGKTTVLEAGASTWGDPQATMAKWNATRVALENRLSVVRGISVSIDETSNAERVETIRDMLYAIPQNRSKDRGQRTGGNRPPLTWHTVALTSGERSIVSFTRDGGTAARVLEIVGSPLGPHGREISIAVKDGVIRHYGQAGPAFVHRLRELLRTDDGRERLKARHADLAKLHATGSALNRRRAPAVAALHLAAYLAHEWGILTSPPPPQRTWRELHDRDDSHDDRPAEALAVVRNWVASHPHRLYTGHLPMLARLDSDKTDPPPQGWAGRAETGGGFSLDPTVLEREILRPAGYELDAVRGAWVEDGSIEVTTEGGKLRYTHKRGMGTGKARLMAFTPEEDEGV